MESKLEFPQSAILTPYNYFEWKPKIQLHFRSRGLFRIPMETEVEPTSAMEKTRYFNRMDEAFGILCLYISPELLIHVESCSTPNEVWKILEELFGKQNEMLRMVEDSIAIYRNSRENFSLEPEDPHVASLYATNYVQRLQETDGCDPNQGLQETDGCDPNQLEGTIRGTVYAPGCANVACTGNEPKKDNVAAFGFEAATSAQVSSSLQDDVKEFAEKCPGATKRLIRRRFNDPPVQADMKLWPFKVVSVPGDNPMIEDDNKRDSSDQRPPGGRPPGTSVPMQQLSKQGKADLRNLESFLIWNNSFSGRLPERLGRDSNLVSLDDSTNNFTGPVPPDLCAQGVPFKLILFSNGFEGEIPYSLARCRSLYRLRMADNRLSGSMPRGLLGMLPNSTFADLSMNNLTGGIPAELIDSPRLQYLNFSHNPLGGRLPEKIWSAPGLHVFSASFANLSGKLPAFTKRNSLQILQLQGNALSGSIPRDIIHCQKLARLELGHNEITGLIPAQLANIPEINSIELSHNELAGTIPAEFNNCSSLKFFNVSYNDLSGQVPSGGVFQHISASAFAGNQFLCGGVLGACVNLSHGASQDSNRRPRTKPGALVWVMGAGFTVSVFIVIIGTHYYKRYRTRSRGISQRADPYQAQGTHPLYIEEGTWKMTAFGRLAFTVEDVLKSMKSTNIIGNGPLSTVYKAEMPGGDTIAIKKLQLEQRLNQDTLQELDAMGKARHRNILRLLGFCHNNEHSLIFLYEFMPNGSLVGQYHNKKEFGWATRYQIAEGIAHGLCYLHHDCNPPIVHGVLKPSNVLLDGHMEPQVSDFCMAKLPDDAMCSTAYISPEHEALRDEKSDIYSFGVILLELLTGMSAVDSEGVSIVDLVRAKCTEIRRTEGSLMDILDKNMNMQPAVKENQAMMLLHVALLCTNRRPFDRPSMRDVVSMLSEKKPLRKTVMDFHSSLTQGSTSAFPM